MPTSRRCWRIWRRRFPLWKASGEQGWGAPRGPAWRRAELAAAGGRLDAVTVREPTRRHGRSEVRMVWALGDPTFNQYAGSAGEVGQPWPHLGQVCRVERERVVRTVGGVVAKREREVRYYITSLPVDRADAALLATHIRGHWGIENRSHWVRDVTFGEDGSTLRSGAAPEVRAACLNLGIAVLRRAGHTNIAAALRTHAGRPAQAVRLIAQAGIG